MAKPNFRDVVYEAFFVGGYGAAVKNGRLTKELHDAHFDFFRSIDRGRPLVDFCHLVETYYGDRKTFIACLLDPTLGEPVELLFAARNAFIHRAWVVDKMDNKKQIAALHAATAAIPIHKAAPNFSMSIDSSDRLQIEGLQSICQTIANAVP